MQDALAAVTGPPPLPPMPPEAFRTAMRSLAAQVCILAAGEGARLTGMTATSVSSLSVEPPAITVGIARTASIHDVLAETRAFSVSGLGRRHRALADRFAGRDGSKGRERFSMGEWRRLSSGALVLADAVFTLDCEVASLVEWSTHSIVIGRVRAVGLGAGEPLLYAQGGYAALAPAG